MSQTIRALQPTALWNNFSDLNDIPRPSKREERVIEFMKEFGNSLDLPTFVDPTGNVIIRKPATPGMENRKTVVLQSHLDMVHQKNSNTVFDFDSEGIKMIIDGDWVKAEGTTLGADNGIGVASIMSLLSSSSIPHPALEALFTVDEETGMTGALELKGGLLDGEILLNLDTEDDDELTIGCAGGIDVTALGNYNELEVNNDNLTGYKLTVRGLSGGHSGMDIHKGLGNSNKLMNRLLTTINNQIDLTIHSIDGGGLRNAIPRESVAEFFVLEADANDLRTIITRAKKELEFEYSKTDPNIEIILEEAEVPGKSMPPEFQDQILRAIYACPIGIYRMSPDVDNLVQTSNNLARVLVKDGNYRILSLTRGSVGSEKLDLAQAIKSSFELIGAEVMFSGDYPGWIPKPDAEIVKVMKKLYFELFNKEAKVYACHAGLECGILGTNYPNMEMISFGPNIRGAHSPDERVQVSSVVKFWHFLLETLVRIPEKGN